MEGCHAKEKSGLAVAGTLPFQECHVMKMQCKISIFYIFVL